jgi:hypothetical protein
LAKHGESIDYFINLTIEKMKTGDGPVVPFCRNIYGKTSLHILADQNDVKHTNEMLQILGQSGTYHHSMDISDILGWILQENVPNIAMYLSSRLIETSTTKAINKGQLKNPEETNITTSKITMNDQKIREEFF